MELTLTNHSSCGQIISTKTMDATSTGSGAQGTLTTIEQIHCHKARIFSLLAKAPVVRAWKDAVCDGAVYIGKASLPDSYADRYFQVFSRQEICYVTFSIVTAFKETGLDAEGLDIERSQCHISTAQREASEFLIVTFSDDYDRIALLPRSLYWPVEGNGRTGNEDALSDEVPASILSDYSYSIRFLLAYIEDIRRLTANPMHPTTTPFQISLDGMIPRADYPAAIAPQSMAEQRREWQKESQLRIIHQQFPKMQLPMRIDFLDYQPLLRDFKIVILSCKRFPDGLEAVISHSVGSSDTPRSDDDNHHLRYADYLLTHGFTFDPDYAFFIPRRLIPEDWFVEPHPEEAMPAKLRDSVDKKEFLFEMDKAGTWVRNIWRIISKYPPSGHPTSAEEKQEIWKKAFPWPETEAQLTQQEASLPQKARGDIKQPSFKRDSGTGDDGAVKPSDVSLLAAHYFKKVSLGDTETAKDTE